MGYDRQIYEKVENDLYKLRLKSIEDLENKKNFLYARFPRAKEIEKTLNSISILAAKAVLKKGNVKQTLENLKDESKKLKEEFSQIISSAGFKEDYFELKHRCTACNDEGFIDGKMCSCMKELLRKESYKRFSDMSPVAGCIFKNFSLDYYDDIGEPSPKKRMTYILDYCKSYARDFNSHSKSLLFKGNTGLGKTHLSMSIAVELIHKGFSVIYTSAHNIVTSMEKERFNYSQQVNSEKRDYFLDCDLLIIDDLGAEFSTSFSNGAIYDIIDTRLILDRPVIISTNLSASKFEEKYTPQIESRVFGCYVKLDFLGKDVRQRIRIEKTVRAKFTKNT